MKKMIAAIMAMVIMWGGANIGGAWAYNGCGHEGIAITKVNGATDEDVTNAIQSATTLCQNTQAGFNPEGVQILNGNVGFVTYRVTLNRIDPPVPVTARLAAIRVTRAT